MPNHQSAKKRVRQNKKRRLRNRQAASTARTFIKKVRSALELNDAAAAQEALPGAVNALNRAASKGVIPKKQASRKISRLTLAVNKAAQ
jgi:small subunit ribosomal protein S20